MIPALIILTLTSWIVVLSLVLALCLAARLGDRRQQIGRSPADSELDCQPDELRRVASVASTRSTASSTVSSPPERSTRSGWLGSSYGAPTPVRPGSSPARARA